MSVFLQGLVYAVCFLLTVSLSHAERIDPASDINYQGAFRLLAEYSQNHQWEYGGYALAFRVDGDPEGGADGFPGSLYSVGKQPGSSVRKLVSEFSIPPAVNSSSLNDLNTASTLQPFADITDGFFDQVLQNHQLNLVRGLAYLDFLPDQSAAKLFWSIWSAYNVQDENLPSQGYSDLSIASPNAQGVWKVAGFHSKMLSGYLFPIPNSFADSHTDGKNLAVGITRAGGAYCRGPGLFAIAPHNYSNAVPPDGGALPVMPLIYYDRDHDTFPNYVENDTWRGGAWITAGDKEAVIFVGVKCLGEVCYGNPDYCSDGCGGGKGYHCYPRQPQMIFYDPNDLKDVAKGQKHPWDPQPYAVLNLQDVIPFYEECTQTQGATYDRNNHILYIIQYQGDGTKPLVHAFSVSDQPAERRPAPPQSLRMVD